jgi:hypothetical protein
MSDFALHHPGGELPLSVTPSSEGPSGLGVGSLLKETGEVTLDPGFVNTAACASAITFIDGDAGILRYRGYPIEQLAEHSTFLEVAYLLIHGELPTADELAGFTESVPNSETTLPIAWASHLNPSIPRIRYWWMYVWWVISLAQASSWACVGSSPHSSR